MVCKVWVTGDAAILMKGLKAKVVEDNSHEGVCYFKPKGFGLMELVLIGTKFPGAYAREERG